MVDSNMIYISQIRQFEHSTTNFLVFEIMIKYRQCLPYIFDMLYDIKS